MKSPYTFDLDKAVASWRRFHEQRRVFTREDLDELENHLREHVHLSIKRGSRPEEAFHEAVQMLGDLDGGAAEYGKVFWRKLRIRHNLSNEMLWRCTMLANYFKVAWRTVRAQKGYVFINLAGLSTGITCCLFILLYVGHELSYDRFYPGADRIFRVVTEYRIQGKEGKHSWTSTPLAETLARDYPEIDKAVRLVPEMDEAGSNLVRTETDDENRYEDGFLYVDPEFLEVFQLPLLTGNRSNVLSQPYSVVLTERKAKSFFPGQNALGKTLILNDNTRQPFRITGILKDLPSNTHLQFDYLLSMEGLTASKVPNWGFSNYMTYVRLAPGADPTRLEARISEVFPRYQGENYKSFVRAGNWGRLVLQPLKDIHLYSVELQGYGVLGDVQYVWLFGAVALFILILAGINFTNLSTARSATRSKEVGLRKVLGSLRRQLVSQFLTESILTSLLALVLGFWLMILLLPAFNGLTGQHLSFPWTSVWIYPLLVFLALILGVLAGAYPAFVLSASTPIRVLKGSLAPGAKGGRFKSILVVFQFVTSIVLMVSSLIVWRQMDYIRNKNLGYNKDQVLIVEDSYMLGGQIGTFKEKLKELPSVAHVSVTSFLPVSGYRENYTSAWRDGRESEKSNVSLAKWFVDVDYLHTMGMKLVEGREFSKERSSDSSAIILNRKAVSQLGLKNPIGERITSYTGLNQETGELFTNTYTIIGVVEDFNFKSLRDEVAGLSLVLGNSGGTTLVKMNTQDLAQTLAGVQQIWATFAPNQPFRYHFLDEQFERMYTSERRAGNLIAVFTGLAILVACLGLFGLAAFSAQQRTKEIGVRKVLGASISGVMALLSGDFLKLVGIAFTISVPLAWFWMHRWLENFAFRTSIDAGVFLLAGSLALLIAAFTVSGLALRAALANPVDSLRYE